METLHLETTDETKRTVINIDNSSDVKEFLIEQEFLRTSEESKTITIQKDINGNIKIGTFIFKKGINANLLLEFLNQ